jgi:chromosome segregation ATPase
LQNLQEESRRQQYQNLGNIQKQLRDFAMICQDMRDKYNHMSSKFNTLKMMKQTIQEFENNNTDILMREINSLTEEKKVLADTSQANADRLQTLEVQLEEERAKTIMLEEKTSRLEQQQNELQRRSEKDIEEQVRKTNNQIRILNESLQKLQDQLEEKEKLLNMIQKERQIIVEEKSELEKEYMELLSRSSSASLKKRSASPDRLGNGTLLRKSQPTMKPLRTGFTETTTTTQRYSNANVRSRPVIGNDNSVLDSSTLSNTSNAHETMKHNEDMEEIHNKTKNLAEKYKEVVSFQQNLSKNLNK